MRHYTLIPRRMLGFHASDGIITCIITAAAINGSVAFQWHLSTVGYNIHCKIPRTYPHMGAQLTRIVGVAMNVALRVCMEITKCNCLFIIIIESPLVVTKIFFVTVNEEQHLRSFLETSEFISTTFCKQDGTVKWMQRNYTNFSVVN